MTDVELRNRFNGLWDRMAKMWIGMEANEREGFVLSLDEWLDEWEQFRWDSTKDGDFPHKPIRERDKK